MAKLNCSVDRCGRPALCKTLCSKHYQRIRDHGSINDRPRGRAAIGVRFWSKVEKTDGCWLWRAATLRQGYGVLRPNGHSGNSTLAHRISWQLHFGPIPDGLFVCHHCDNPPCVRPEHLFLGDCADNNADKIAKGRQRGPTGMANSHAKLTPQQVVEIRGRYRRGSRINGGRALGGEFGVSDVMIGRIARGESWTGEFDV